MRWNITSFDIAHSYVMRFLPRSRLFTSQRPCRHELCNFDTIAHHDWVRMMVRMMPFARRQDVADYDIQHVAWVDNLKHWVVTCHGGFIFIYLLINYNRHANHSHTEAMCRFGEHVGFEPKCRSLSPIADTDFLSFHSRTLFTLCIRTVGWRHLTSSSGLIFHLALGRHYLWFWAHAAYWVADALTYDDFT